MAHSLPEYEHPAGGELATGPTTWSPSISPHAVCGYEFPPAAHAAGPKQDAAATAAVVVAVKVRERAR